VKPETRAAMKRALALANDSVESEFEHIAVARPGPAGAVWVYRCPECHNVGAYPFLVVHSDSCHLSDAADAIRQLRDMPKAESDESTQRASTVSAAG
jgi:hypothetical protein